MLIPEKSGVSGFDSGCYASRRIIDDSLSFVFLILTFRNVLATFPYRSPPQLLAEAA